MNTCQLNCFRYKINRENVLVWENIASNVLACGININEGNTLERGINAKGVLISEMNAFIISPNRTNVGKNLES